jgi:hypothetical protein
MQQRAREDNATFTLETSAGSGESKAKSGFVRSPITRYDMAEPGLAGNILNLLPSSAVVKIKCAVTHHRIAVAIGPQDWHHWRCNRSCAWYVGSGMVIVPCWAILDNIDPGTQARTMNAPASPL